VLSGSDLPGSADHFFEVIVFINACADVAVVLLKLRAADAAIFLDAVPLGEEFAQHILLRHFSRFKFGMERAIVHGQQVIHCHFAIACLVQFRENFVYEGAASGIQSASYAAEEFVVTDLSIVVLVEIFENALKLGWAERVSIFLETPHEFLAVHSFVSVVIHAAEH
jgi:hypothetical protein